MPKLTLRQYNGLVQSAGKLGDPAVISDGKNFILNDDRTPRKSWGTQKVREGHGLTNIDDLFIHDDDSDLTFAHGNGSLEVFDGSTWNTVQAIDSDNMDFRSYLKDVYMFYGDAAEYYDVSASAVVDLDAANQTWFLANGGTAANYAVIRGHSPVVHLNAMWIAGRDEYNNAVLRTKPYSKIFYDIGVGNLPFLQFVSVGADGSPSGSVDDEIVSMVVLNTDLYALKNKSVHRLLGLSTNQFRFQQISNTIGCKFKDSVQSTPAGMIFLEDAVRGVWMYNGSFQNISRGRVDAKLASVDADEQVRSTVLKSRWYLLTWSKGMLVYDTQLDAWGFVECPYGALTTATGLTLGASNKYTTTTTTVTDPQRPTEPQTVLPKTADSTDIVQFDLGNAFETEADGSDEESFEYEVTTSLLDFGDIDRMKAIYEVNLDVLTAQPDIYMDLIIDGRVYADRKAVINPKPLFDRAYYAKDEYREIQRYRAKFLPPMTCSGYSIKLRFHSDTPFSFDQDAATIKYQFTGE